MNYIVTELVNYYGNTILSIEHKDHRSVKSLNSGKVLFTGMYDDCHKFIGVSKGED